MKNRKGFTLIEIIVTIALISILAGTGAMLLSESFRLAFQQLAYNEMDHEVRLPLARMSRELRLIRDTPALDVQDHRLSFTTVLGESVTYFLSGNQLMRNQQVLMDSVTSLHFTHVYRRYLQVDIGFQQGDIQETYRLAIHLRNTF